MKKILFVPATIVAVVFALAMATASAADKKEGADSVEAQMDNLVKLGAGVHNIKKDSKGRVQSVILVGQSRVSTVLGTAEGKQRARQRAEQSAKAQFVKWFGDNVDFRTNSDNETTIFLQGEEGNDKDAQSEAGKKVEKDSDSYKSVAAGLVRGLQLLHNDVNPEDKVYTIVYGWSLANAKAAKDAHTNDPGIEKEPSATQPAEKKSSDKDVPGKKLRRQKATSKEAGQFLK